MAKKSLLEQAVEIKTERYARREITTEEIELVLGWLTGVVTGIQATKALGMKSPGQFQSRASIVLREAHKQGFLKVK